MRLLLSDSPVRNAAAGRGQPRVRERYLWRSVAASVDRLQQKVMAASASRNPGGGARGMRSPLQQPKLLAFER